MESKCNSCTELLRCQKSSPPIYFPQYPEWYRTGGQCPECGAGYEGQFGTLDPIKVPVEALDLQAPPRK